MRVGVFFFFFNQHFYFHNVVFHKFNTKSIFAETSLKKAKYMSVSGIFSYKFTRKITPNVQRIIPPVNGIIAYTVSVVPINNMFSSKLLTLLTPQLALYKHVSPILKPSSNRSFLKIRFLTER